MTTRKELVEALRLRYRSAAVSDRIKILDEFVALTCYHRKHAIRVLRGEFSPATVVRLRNRVYDESVAQALTVLWEAAEQVVVEAVQHEDLHRRLSSGVGVGRGPSSQRLVDQAAVADGGGDGRGRSPILQS